MMSGLRELRLRTSDGRPAAASLLLGPRPPPDVRGEEDTPRFQLHMLHWGCHSDAPAIAEFLPTQHELRLLYIDTEAPYCALIGDSLVSQHLEFVGGNRDIVEAVLSYRDVTCVAWILELDDSTADVSFESQPSQKKSHLREKEILQAWKRVKVLQYGGYFWRPRFGSLARYLESVEVLELAGCSDEVSYQRLGVLSLSSHQCR